MKAAADASRRRSIRLLLDCANGSSAVIQIQGPALAAPFHASSSARDAGSLERPVSEHSWRVTQPTLASCGGLCSIVMEERDQAPNPVTCSSCGASRPPEVATTAPRPPCPECGAASITLQLGVATEVNTAMSLNVALAAGNHGRALRDSPDASRPAATQPVGNDLEADDGRPVATRADGAPAKKPERSSTRPASAPAGGSSSEHTPGSIASAACSCAGKEAP